MVANFIQHHATCHMPNQDSAPLLCSNVKSYQFHVCNKYCLRRFKSNKGYVSVCRFGFPRPTRTKFLFRDISKSIAQRSRGKFKKRFYELPRKANETRINDYNAEVSLLWSGNIDVQFIGEETSALASYICGYVTKKEKTNTELWQEIDESKPIHQQLYGYMFQKLKNRECGIIEAIDRLRSQPLYQKSRKTLYINAKAPSERTVCLKPHAELVQQAEEDPESTDKYMKNYIDDYYPNRPRVLEDMCYYEFRKNYERVNKPEKGLQFLNSTAGVKKLNDPYLISHTIYKRQDEQEKYRYSLLLMFKPFRNEREELLDESGNCGDIFLAEIDRNELLAQYHTKMQAQFAQLEVQREQVKRAAEMPDTPGSGSVEPLAVAPRFDDVVDELMQALAAPTAAETTLEDDVHNMNTDQIAVFHVVTEELEKQNPSFKMFLSGAGGTGKSFLIHAIRKYMHKRFEHGPNRVCMIICAPTGLAAFSISGQTCHRIFRLPVQHGSRQSFFPLGHNEQKALETVMRHTKLIVIDEISMVSSLMLLYICKRLQEITRCDERFGGRCLLAVGDLAQLPPVNAPFIFEPVPAAVVQNGLGLAAVNLWQEDFNKYMELTINQRQKEDAEYAAILNALRFGQLTEEHADTLAKRLIPLDENSQGGMIDGIVEKFFQLQKEDNEVMLLMPRVKMVDQINMVMLNRLGQEIIQIPAIKKIHGCTGAAELKKRVKQLEKRAGNITTTAGIEMLLELAAGCRIMLRRNINTSTGLVNGAIGTLQEIVRAIDGAILALKIKFDKISQPQTIERYSAVFNLTSKIVIMLEQFPVILSFAATIHKAQGLSLKTLMLDAGSMIFAAGMTYVGLSRVRSLAGLHLLNWDPHQARAHLSAIHEINRLRSLHQPHIPPESTELKILKRRPDRMWYVPLSRKEMAMDPGADLENDQEDAAAAQLGTKKSSAKLKGAIGRKKRTREDTIPKTDVEQIAVLARRFGVTRKDSKKDPNKKEQRKKEVKSFSKKGALGFPSSQSSIAAAVADLSLGDDIQSSPLMPGFQNVDKFICYANSAAHLLFACDTFRNMMCQGVFQQRLPSLAMLLEAYEMQQIAGGFDTILSMDPVRESFGEFFRYGQQQDCSEFVLKILDKLDLLDIFRLRVLRRPCGREDCLGHAGPVESSFLPSLWLHVIPKKGDSLQELINSCLATSTAVCGACGARSREEAADFSTPPDYLLVQIVRHTEYGFYSGPVTADEVLRIGGTAYELICVIQHFGANMTSGHYVALVRCGQEWISCNDENTSVLVQFPTNLQNAYLVLLKKMQTIVSGQIGQRSPLRLHGATASDTEPYEYGESDHGFGSDTEALRERKRFTPEKGDKRLKKPGSQLRTKRKLRRSEEYPFFQQAARRFKAQGGNEQREQPAVAIVWPVFLMEHVGQSFASAAMHLLMASDAFRTAASKADTDDLVPGLRHIALGYISAIREKELRVLDLQQSLEHVRMLTAKQQLDPDPFRFISLLLMNVGLEKAFGIKRILVCRAATCKLRLVSRREFSELALNIDARVAMPPWSILVRNWSKLRVRCCETCGNQSLEEQRLFDRRQDQILIQVNRMVQGKYRDCLIPGMQTSRLRIGEVDYEIVAMVTRVGTCDEKEARFAAIVSTGSGWLRLYNTEVIGCEFSTYLGRAELLLLQKKNVYENVLFDRKEARIDTE